MTAIADGVADVMKERGGFEQDAHIGRKVMHRLKLVEQLQAQFANVFGVTAVAVQTAGEGARADKKLARVGVVAMRLLAGKGFTRDFPEEAFANANAGNRKRAQIQVAAQRDENQSGDAHDVGAIAADAKRFHSRFDVAFQEVRQSFAQERKLERGKAVFAGAGRQIGKRFRVTSEGDR